MEITKTRLQLVHDVAGKLRVVGTGQQLEAEYAEEIDQRIDPLLIQLMADDVCIVGNTEAIPSEWFDCIAGLLANLCAPVAGLAFSPDVKMFYEMQLKRMTSSKPSFEVLATEYF